MRGLGSFFYSKYYKGFEEIGKDNYQRRFELISRLLEYFNYDIDVIEYLLELGYYYDVCNAVGGSNELDEMFEM